ncbi:hypothetical protein P4S72_08770 [Vibrio sp. PP-XX7]
MRVRQALSLATNKQAIIDAVFQSAGKIAKKPNPANHVVSAITMWLIIRVDPVKAKQVLESSGLPEWLPDQHLGDAGFPVRITRMRGGWPKSFRKTWKKAGGGCRDRAL